MSKDNILLVPIGWSLYTSFTLYINISIGHGSQCPSISRYVLSVTCFLTPGLGLNEMKNCFSVNPSTRSVPRTNTCYICIFFIQNKNLNVHVQYLWKTLILIRICVYTFCVLCAIIYKYIYVQLTRIQRLHIITLYSGISALREPQT